MHFIRSLPIVILILAVLGIEVSAHEGYTYVTAPITRSVGQEALRTRPAATVARTVPQPVYVAPGATEAKVAETH